eukprot:6178695-Pleurochrysis_carterae.AAC.1
MRINARARGDVEIHGQAAGSRRRRGCSSAKRTTCAHGYVSEHDSSVPRLLRLQNLSLPFAHPRLHFIQMRIGTRSQRFSHASACITRNPLACTHATASVRVVIVKYVSR